MSGVWHNETETEFKPVKVGRAAMDHHLSLPFCVRFEDTSQRIASNEKNLRPKELIPDIRVHVPGMSAENAWAFH